MTDLSRNNENEVPSIAKILGYFGLLPFLALSINTWFGNVLDGKSTHEALQD